MATSIENVVIFGDSIAHGYGVPDHNSWVQMLRADYFALNQNNPHAGFAGFLGFIF